MHCAQPIDCFPKPALNRLQTHHPFLLIVLIVVFALTASPSMAAEVAGHVIISKGSVVALAEDGTKRPLKRRSQFFSGDTITTGKLSSVQLRFVDKALMTVKADTELNITQYLFKQQGAAPGSDKALMKLVKGGFRTITGQIGKGDKSAYTVNTPAASIGIRGTNYEVQQEGKDAFVMAVYSGGIRVENDAGTLDLGLGEDFNYVRVTPTSSPKGLLSPPRSLRRGSVVELDAEEEEDSESSDDNTSENDGEEDGDSNEDTADTDDGSSVPLTDDDDGSATLVSTDSSNDNAGAPTTELDTRIATEIASQDDSTRESLGQLNEVIDTVLTEEILNEASNNDDVKAVLENLGLADLDDLADFFDQGNKIDDEDADPNTGSGGDTGTNLADLTDPYNGITVTASADPRLTNAEYSLLTNGNIAALAIPVDSEIQEAALFSPTKITSFDNEDLFNYGRARQIGGDVSTGFNFDGIGTSSITMDINGNSQPLLLSDIGNYNNADDLVAAVNTAIANAGLGSKIGANHIDGTLFFENLQTSLGGYIDIQNIDSALQPLGFSTGKVDNFNALTMTFVWKTSESPAEQNITLSLDALIGSVDDLITELNDQLDDNGAPFRVSIDEEFTSETRLTVHALDQDTVSVVQLGISDISYSDNAGGGENNFVSMLGNMQEGLQFSSVDDIDVVIGKGTIDTNGEMVFVEDIDDDSAGTEVIRRGTPNQTVDSLIDLAVCQDGGNLCDVAVYNVDQRPNVAWGLWAADATHPLEFYKDPNNPTAFETEQDVAVYWLAAERADVNTLTGTGTFSQTLDCTDFSQCIGSANDGYVHKLDGKFDVNFNTGAVTNGALNIEVANDFNLSGNQTTVTTWDVQFQGTVSGAGMHAGVDSANSHISGLTNCTGCVNGEVGGIFVKPGDGFAGGYNLRKTDNLEVHAEGVFLLDKAP